MTKNKQEKLSSIAVKIIDVLKKNHLTYLQAREVLQSLDYMFDDVVLTEDMPVSSKSHTD